MMNLFSTFTKWIYMLSDVASTLTVLPPLLASDCRRMNCTKWLFYLNIRRSAADSSQREKNSFWEWYRVGILISMRRWWANNHQRIGGTKLRITALSLSQRLVGKNSFIQFIILDELTVHIFRNATIMSVRKWFLNHWLAASFAWASLFRNSSGSSRCKTFIIRISISLLLHHHHLQLIADCLVRLWCVAGNISEEDSSEEGDDQGEEEEKEAAFRRKFEFVSRV